MVRVLTTRSGIYQIFNVTRPKNTPRSAPGVQASKSAVEDFTDEQDAVTFFDELTSYVGYPLQIFRRPASGTDAGNNIYCDTVDAAGFTLAELRSRFGGGRYILKLQDSQTKKYTKSRLIVIEGPPVTHQVPATAPVQQPQAQPIGAAPSSLKDMMEMMTMMIGAVAKITASSKSDNSGSSAKELLEMWALGRAEGERVGELKSAMPDTGNDLVKTGLTVLELMKANQGNPAALAAPPATTPAAPVPPLPQPHHVNAEESVPYWVLLLRPYIPTLLQKARDGRNAAVYAALIVEEIPDAVLDKFAELISSDTFPGVFLNSFPAFRAYEAWVIELITACRESLQPEDEEQLAEKIS